MGLNGSIIGVFGSLLLPALLYATSAHVAAQTPATLADPVTQVAAGGQHTCTLSATGVVRCWGDNQYGQVGNNSTATRQVLPVVVSGLAGVVSLSAGAFHTCALLAGGAVKCWGRNISGQLGDNSTTDRSTPVDVVGLSGGVVALDARGFHTCALMVTGAVKCWGNNSFGQLGDGSTTDRAVPGDVVGLGGGITAIAAGGSHTCALNQSGGVQCWGLNNAGQVGDGTTTNRSTPVPVVGLGSGVAALSLGYYHSCALFVAGGVQCWGLNDRGQLGNGGGAGSPVPVAVTDLATGVTAIAAGYYHVCAIITGGAVKCWGWNAYGNLGDGSNSNRPTPVAVSNLGSGVAAISVGAGHSCALLTLGGVKCWGYNFFGQVGDASTSNRTAPVNVSWHTTGVLTVAAGASHSCAVTQGGAATCWGANADGQIGDGSTTNRTSATPVTGFDSGVAAVSTGAYHSCALTSSGGVWCWGRNSGGQLGNNSTTNSSLPVAVVGLGAGVAAISAGGYHTCALTNTGAMKCWGLNDSGQLGDNSTTTRLTPVDVSGLGSGVSAISGGALHTCAVVAGAAKCWGYNYWGTVGDNSTTQRQVPTAVSGLGSGVAAIAAGTLHTCALVAGDVKCWGYNATGQLGDNSTTQRLTPTNVVGLGGTATALVTAENHSCALLAGGGVRCWGENSAGQLGDGSNLTRLTPVDVASLADAALLASAHGGHSCAVTNPGGLKCWGRNGNGQVGDSSTSNRNAAVAIRSAQSIVFNPSNTVVVATTLPLSASASGGMPVTYDSWTPSTCNVSAATLSISGAVGQLCGVRASQVPAPLSGGGSLAPAPQQLRVLLIIAPPPILDIDSSAPSTQYDAATDGVLLLRYLLGYRGASLVASATGQGAQRDATQIAAHLAANQAKFDVDGDGQTLALTDGIMILRRMLGITSAAAVTQGAKQTARSDADVLLAIEALMP